MNLKAECTGDAGHDVEAAPEVVGGSWKNGGEGNYTEVALGTLARSTTGASALRLVHFDKLTMTLSRVLVRGGDIVSPTGESSGFALTSCVIGVTNIWFF